MPVSFSNVEYSDIMLVYGYTNQNAREAVKEYQRRFPLRRVPNKSVFPQMTPNLTGTGTGLLLAEAEVVTTQKPIPRKPLLQSKSTIKPAGPKYEWHIVWRNVLAFAYLHIGALYGTYLLFTQAKVATMFFVIFVTWYSGLGITAGAHRLWAHKCYKANAALRLLLAFCNSSAFQNHIYEWVRDHRAHHKFTDTDADPHNSSRGFFFSHMGWLLIRKHGDVRNKGKAIDMSDLEKDWVVMFQKKFYPILMPICTFVIPTMVPVYLWGEDGWTAWYVTSVMRYTFVLHGTWLVNSAAHLWGTRPYDKFISPVENIYVAVLAFGEGWHNYHHAFPWDYKTSEFSGYRANYTTAFIDFFAWLGWAYDLKTVKTDMIEKRANRTGDGSHPADQQKTNKDHRHGVEGEVWGWDDKDLTDKDRAMVSIINPKEEKTEGKTM